MSKPELLVEFLGPLRVSAGDTEFEVTRSQGRRLATLLALRPGVPVAPDELADQLWHQSKLPKDYRAALRVTASRLRAAIQPHGAALESTASGYCLHARTDLEEAEALLGRTRSIKDPAERTDLLRIGLALWRGPVLPDLPDVLAAHPVRQRVDELRHQMIADLVEDLLATGNTAEAISVAAPDLDSDPTQERLARALALALASDGRKSDALQVIARTRLRLREALGLDTSEALDDCEAQILQGAVELGGTVSVDRYPTATTFVGRAEEIEALLAADGPSWVTGEPGIGKSSLLGELAGRYRQLGHTVVVAKSPEAPERPMQLLAEIIERMPADLAVPAAVSRLVSPPNADAGPVPIAIGRADLLSTCVDFLIDHAARRPVVLLIDDCQWIDLGSAEVIRALADRDQDAAVDLRMVLFSRPRTNPGAHPVRELSQARNRIALGPLDSDSAQELATLELGRELSGSELDELVRRTGGSPFFLTLLLQLTREGAMLDDTLPPSILVAVQRRIEELSPTAQRSLRLASVLGKRFPIDPLAEPLPDVESGLAEAEQAGLVTIDSEHHRGEFTHDLVFEAIYEMLPRGERVTWHDHFGRSMEKAGYSAVEFVTHCDMAAELDPLRSVQAHERASRECALVWAWDQSLEHAAAGLALLETGLAVPPVLVADLALLRASALRRLGQQNEAELTTAAELAEATGDQRRLVEAVVELCSNGGTTHTAVAHHRAEGFLETTLALDLTREERALLSAVAAPLLANTDRCVDGRNLYFQALAIVEPGDLNPSVEIEVLLQSHLGLTHPDDLDQRLANAGRLRELASGVPDFVWEAAFLEFTVAIILAQREDATRCVNEMRRLTPLVRYRNRDLGLAFSEAAFHILTGDLEHAEDCMNRIPESGVGYDDSWIMAIYGAILIGIRDAQGRRSELRGLADQMLAQAPGYVAWEAVSAGVAAAENDKATARKWIDALSPNDFERVELTDMPSTAFLSLIADAVVLLEDRAAAKSLVKRLSPYSGRLAWSGLCTHGPLDDKIAALHQLLGDEVQATKHRERARILTGQAINA